MQVKFTQHVAHMRLGSFRGYHQPGSNLAVGEVQAGQGCHLLFTGRKKPPMIHKPIIHLALGQSRAEQFRSDLAGPALFALGDGLQGLEQFLTALDAAEMVIV